MASVEAIYRKAEVRGTDLYESFLIEVTGLVSYVPHRLAVAHVKRNGDRELRKLNRSRKDYNEFKLKAELIDKLVAELKRRELI